jgi:dihydrodipicolinate reductase
LPPAAAPPPVPGKGRSRLFGGRKRQDLEAENAHLRAELDRLRGMTGAQIAAQVEQSRQQLAAVAAQIADAERALHERRTELDRVGRQVVETNETALLQESGVYEYRHRLADAVAYKNDLDYIKQTIRSMVRDGTAVLSSKLLLRAYNAEADNCVRTVKPHNRAAVIARLEKTRETIARLGRTMNIEIVEPYHRVRVMEIELTADHAAKVEEEKEQIRAQREAQREEEKARREFEREKARLLKERAHFENALTKVREQGGDVAELEARLAPVDEAIAGVEAREANIRAGFVYVISNVGAFGPEVVKIGLTRRLDPADRIRELGDASVPFKFDTHATCSARTRSRWKPGCTRSSPTGVSTRSTCGGSSSGSRPPRFATHSRGSQVSTYWSSRRYLRRWSGVRAAVQQPDGELLLNMARRGSSEQLTRTRTRRCERSGGKSNRAGRLPGSPPSCTRRCPVR